MLWLQFYLGDHAFFSMFQFDIYGCQTNALIINQKSIELNTKSNKQL